MRASESKSEEKVDDLRDRQVLYLTYRGMPAHPITGKRMTQAAAASLAGVGTSTVSRWRTSDPEFAAQDRQVRTEGIARARDTAKAGANALIASSIKTLGRLMDNPAVKDSVQARIAIRVLEWAGVAEAIQIELGGDRWGALIQRLIDSTDGDDDV